MSPIQIGGSETKSITLRRPKVKDRLAVDKMGDGKSDVEKELLLLSTLSGLAPEEFEEMDLADYTSLQETLQSFIVARPKR